MMGTAIEWTDETWNPWHGCRKVSPGCAKCYMYRDKDRYGQDPRAVLRSKTTFSEPLKWAKDENKHGQFVFTCSWSDFFIEQADGWRDEAWDIIRRTPQLCYQILTKRPERIRQCLPLDWGHGFNNVWLGVSVESQAYITRIASLLEVPAAKYFVSYEPALGPIDLNPNTWRKIDWLIAGGESDYNPRLPEPDWLRSVRDQCQQNGVDFFFKQWGGNPGQKGGKDAALLDGQLYHARPHFEPEQAVTQMSLF